MARLTPQRLYASEQAPVNHCLNYNMVQLNVAFESSVNLTVWQVICTMFQHLSGKREWEQRQGPPICVAIYSTWVASSKDTVGRNVRAWCLSGISCQKVVKIYRQRFILKRPGLANEVSRFVGYGFLSHLIPFTCFPSHSITVCVFPMLPWTQSSPEATLNFYFVSQSGHFIYLPL